MTCEEPELLTDIRVFYHSIACDFETQVLQKVRVVYREQLIKKKYLTVLFS